MNQKQKRPPWLLRLILYKMRNYQENYLIAGDIEETFHKIVSDKGHGFAYIWFCIQVIFCFVKYITDTVCWRITMLFNYFRIGFRNIWTHKKTSFLNALSLSTGMVIFIIIFLHIQYELSYDRYHGKGSRIYRVFQKIGYLDYSVATTSAPLAKVLAEEFPEIESAVRIEKRGGEILVTRGEESFFEQDFIWADPAIFHMFSLPLIHGDKKTALDNPYSTVISEKAAYKYFGMKNPLGHTLRCTISNENFELIVTGVFKDMVPNSHFHADFLVPFNTLGKIPVSSLEWGNNAYYTYILLRDGTSPKKLESKLKTTDFKRYSGGYDLHDYHLQSLLDIHLRSHLRGEIEPNGNIKSVVLFSFIALLIMVIACMNSINLATAQAVFRVKEVGVRKVIGAHKSQLIRQFLSESMILTLFSFFIAMGVVSLVFPAFRNFIENPIAFQPFQNIPLLVTLVALIGVTGILSGCYPAFLLASFKPIFLFRPVMIGSKKGFLLRNALVTGQFSISIALIICTLIARNQLHHLKNRHMGYNRERIVVLPIQNAQLKTNIETVRIELKKNPLIRHVSVSSSLLHNIRARLDAHAPKKPDGTQYSFYTLETDDDFVNLYEIEILEGRNFSRKYGTDEENAFLINETAAKILEWKDPVGQELVLLGNRRGTIVGIMKDFHIQSLYQPIEPVAVYLKNNPKYLSIKISSNNIPLSLRRIEKTLNAYAPGYPFQYSFFDNVFDRTFKTDQKTASLISMFTIIAVFIACLGLLGMVLFSVQRRIKEIGIRKVLGGSVSGIVALVGREFIKWILLANAIAWPVGYWVMRRWLQNFAYRVQLSPAIFILSAMLTLIIAAGTILIMTIKTARANPVDTLRYE